MKLNGNFRDSAELFATKVLEVPPLYEWQSDICEAIDRCSSMERVKLAAVCPNGAGKTSVVMAVSILRWLERYPRGKVVVTSSDGKQLDAQLMPALVKHQHRFPSWEFLSRQIRTKQGGFLLAFSTNEASKAEGHHGGKDAPLLIIVDEAKSIDEAIFEAFDRCTYAVILYISSPGLKAGRFYDSFSARRDQFMTFQIGLKDCKHISEARIADVIDTYGPLDPMTRSTLHGEFMDYDEETSFAFDFNSVMETITNPPHARISRHEHSGFCDFAQGRDENTFAMRSGNKLLELHAWRDRDTNAAVGRFIMTFRRYNLRPEQIWGDADGAGHPMCDMLAAAGWPINRFRFGAPAHNDAVYVSRGAEIWDTLSQRVLRGEIVLINDPVLISQLTTRKVTYDARGRRKLESKDDMRSRGLKSPDRADAVIGAFAHGTQNFATFAKRADGPFDQLERYYDGFDRNQDRYGRQTELEDMGAWPGE